MLENDVVLVVDDSATARTAITNVLRDRLYCQTIIEAANGQEALKRLQANPDIDWIFCDWEMPVMAGDELLSKVRENPATSHLPFIMITAKGDRDSLVTAVQLGVTSFVVKPFTPKKLIEKVLLARGRMERRNAERIKATRGQQLKLKWSQAELPVEADLLDVSLSGLLLLAPFEPTKSLSVFDLAQLAVTLPNSGATGELPCQIIRLEADPLHPARDDQIRIAVRFQPMSAEQRKLLMDYIEATRRLAPQPESEPA